MKVKKNREKWEKKEKNEKNVGCNASYRKITICYDHKFLTTYGRYRNPPPFFLAKSKDRT